MFFLSTSNLFVFADSTKFLLTIRSTDDIDKLQSDVNNTVMWSQSTDLLNYLTKHICDQILENLPFWHIDWSYIIIHIS